MANHVGKRLLKYAKKGGAQILLEHGVAQGRLHITANPGAVLKFIGLPFEGRSQTQMIEDTWTQFSGYAPDHTDCGIDVSGERFRFFNHDGKVSRKAAGNP